MKYTSSLARKIAEAVDYQKRAVAASPEDKAPLEETLAEYEKALKAGK